MLGPDEGQQDDKDVWQDDEEERVLCVRACVRAVCLQNSRLTHAKRYRTLGMTKDCHSMSSRGGSTAVKRERATFCWPQYQAQ